MKELFQPLNNLSKISKNTIEKFNKINIHRVIDVLLYFPRSIKIQKACQNIHDLEDNTICIITLKVLQHKKIMKYGLIIICQDNTGSIVKIFYFRYFKFTLKYYPLNETITVVATCNIYKGELVLMHPQKVLKGNKVNEIDKLECNYKQHKFLLNKEIHKAVQECLKVLQKAEIPEWFDENFRLTENLPSFKEALQNIHNPYSKNNKYFMLRIALDELLAYQLNLQKIKSLSRVEEGIALKGTNILVKDFLTKFPFDLTCDQNKAFKQIKTDLQSTNKNTILLQGDVGSGKSVVCFLSALHAVESGFQVAILAPTGILANQHYINLIKYCNREINVALLQGGAKNKIKQEVINKLASGEINILVTTHAVLQEDITFKKLGLVIIDEQHKFGVEQRLKLAKKGSNVNIILATATPIPRTLILAYYGEINTIEIKAKPNNRKEIITTSLSIEKIKNLMVSLLKKLQDKEKIFWVCPLVESSEGLMLTSIEEREKWFLENYNIKLFTVHGKMKAVKKEEIIENFKNCPSGALLLTTTVIEVGVDIPQCNVLIIEDAQNLGLAQLHQLRGRVGRGSTQGYCILLYGLHISKTAKKRIAILKESTDGFYIAEQDLKIRGYGDIIGTIQSGYEYFISYNIEEHYEYLKPITNLAKIFIQQNNSHIEFLLQIFTKNNSKDYYING